MTFRWRPNDGPLILAFGSSLPHKLKKKVVKVGPPLTKFSGSGHDCAHNIFKILCTLLKTEQIQISWLLKKPAVLDLHCFPSTQLSTKFILLINVKMPTSVGILTFISMINNTSDRLKVRKFFTFRYFSYMSS